jgi:thioredoxin-like negative regulator of GroEL
LAIALGFALLVNLLLLTSLVWTELLGTGFVGTSLLLVAWLAAAVFWSVSVASSFRWCRQHRGKSAIQPAEDLFPLALGEYIQGNWFQVEVFCNQLLARDPRDAEAKLLLASTCRQTGKFDEAREKLADLRRLENGAKWEWEIEQELERVAEDQQSERQTATEDQVTRSPSSKMLDAA